MMLRFIAALGIAFGLLAAPAAAHPFDPADDSTFPGHHAGDVCEETGVLTPDLAAYDPATFDIDDQSTWPAVGVYGAPDENGNRAGYLCTHPGPPGDPGDPGDPGEPGVGDPGPQGPPGESITGPQGEADGADGADGSDGAAALVATAVTAEPSFTG